MAGPCFYPPVFKAWLCEIRRYRVKKLIALQFGGGGHPAAAGAIIPGDLETVQTAVIETTQSILSENEVNEE